MKKTPTVWQDADFLDWFDELEEEGGGLIRTTIKDVLSCQGYLDSYESARLLAAAEWIACLRGHKSLQAGLIVDELLTKTRSAISEKVVKSCLAALERVEEHSELRSLWEEQGFQEQWRDATADLRSRLLAQPVALIRPRVIRVRTDDIFRIPLPGHRCSYGRVYHHEDRRVQIYSGIFDEKASLPDLNGRETLFIVCLLRGPLEYGEWPIVAKGPAKRNTEPPDMWDFGQSLTEFRLRKGGYGWPASVRECRDLEYANYWPADHVVQRILTEGRSTILQSHWPRCLTPEGVLVPKRWSDWVEDDFVRMEMAAGQERPRPS